MHCVVIQIGVLQWFAKLWEIDSNDYWGYITNCGTEGNLHGILVGRENHPEGTAAAPQLLTCKRRAFALSCITDAVCMLNWVLKTPTLPQTAVTWCCSAGVLYASKETHYSVFKAGKMYRMQTEAINTLPTGEIDYEHLQQRLQANKDKPAIINVNIGTTVKGAVDDLDRVLEALTEEGFDEDRFYIHCDGALFGLMVCI